MTRDDDTSRARLLQALLLLQSCLGEATSAREPAQDAWLESSTDVLTPWYPERDEMQSAAWGLPVQSAAWGLPAATSAAAWDAYFARPPAGAAPSAPLTDAAPRADDVLAEADAEAAVEALYGFVHGLGRGDVGAALAHVSDDYHVLEGEREIGKSGLRQQLERLLDTRREADLRVSLARIPEPLPHPLGALVRVSLQFDWQAPGARPESLVLHRVAVLRREREASFRLLALADVQA